LKKRRSNFQNSQTREITAYGPEKKVLAGGRGKENRKPHAMEKRQ